MSDLKACQCKSKRVDFISGNFTNATDHFREGQKFWKVWCKDCQIRTGPEKTKRAAVEVWNTRHITPADVPEAVLYQLRQEWDNELLSRLEDKQCRNLVASLLVRSTED